MHSTLDPTLVEVIELRHVIWGVWEYLIGLADGTELAGRIDTGRSLWGPSKWDVWALKGACQDQLGLDVDRYEWTIESGDTILGLEWGVGGSKAEPFCSEEEPDHAYDPDAHYDWEPRR